MEVGKYYRMTGCPNCSELLVGLIGCVSKIQNGEVRYEVLELPLTASHWRNTPRVAYSNDEYEELTPEEVLIYKLS
jgi:hypothetical protein